MDLPPIHAFSYPPKNKTEFEFEKLPSEKGLVPLGSNYMIEYIGKTDSEQKIYLNLNPFQIFRIKWQLKRYLVQSDNLKVGILKYLIVTIIGFFGGRFYESQMANASPKNSDKTEIKKSSEQMIDNVGFKMDSVNIKKSDKSDSLKNK